MAARKTGKKKTAPRATEIVQEIPDETVIQTPGGMAVGIAIRTAETKDGEFRMLITVRAGRNLEQVKFNFGGAGGVQTFGGDPGGPPSCP